MVLASLQGRSAPEIAVMFAAKEQTVREVISNSMIEVFQR